MVVLESQPLFQKNQFPLMLYQQPLSHFGLERLNIHNRGFFQSPAPSTINTEKPYITFPAGAVIPAVAKVTTPLSAFGTVPDPVVSIGTSLVKAIVPFWSGAVSVLVVAVVICEASNFIFLVLSVLLNISKSLSFASSIVVAVLNF